MRTENMIYFTFLILKCWLTISNIARKASVGSNSKYLNQEIP